MPGERPFVAVCGPSVAGPEELAWAEEVGRLVARAGAVLVCGGLGGVMEAAARGCAAASGTSLGILPGPDRRAGNPHLSVAVATGMGEARNALIVRTADVVIAISGEFGTLSEIALALKMGKPVVGLRTWELSKEGAPADPIVRAGSPAEAVEAAVRLAGRSTTA
ncbi:MAG TPA: TIGR00725 family protein [Actinomycetota bacterium]|nr:TIGR00725 family protein [Actinomycetota bacterium]